MKKSVLIATVAAFGLAAPVFAQTVSFDSADLDMSGSLSLEEVQAASPDVTQDDFDAYDLDADGELGESEFDAWVADQTIDEDPADLADETSDEIGDEIGDELSDDGPY